MGASKGFEKLKSDGKKLQATTYRNMSAIQTLIDDPTKSQAEAIAMETQANEDFFQNLTVILEEVGKLTGDAPTLGRRFKAEERSLKKEDMQAHIEFQKEQLRAETE